MTNARDAFAARVLLADAADTSLDVQYYIWHGDQTGYLLFEALWRAAERGVRVRLLLDDNNTGGLDGTIAALDSHPNIEVRLYNPLANRSVRSLNYVTDFSRVNRRMHNKSFTVDNQATVVGGRNVGNEYFAAGSGVWYEDLDVIAVGPVVRDVSDAFDLYWNSASAYPAASLLRAAPPEAAGALQDKFTAVRADPVSVSYIEALRDTPLVRQLLTGNLPFEWTTVRLLDDDPAKTLDTRGRTDVLLLSSLVEVLDPPQASLDLVSPYFVPGEGGTRTFVALAKRGVKVRALVNSLATTDVSAVHAGYKKRRHELLEAGVVLYEMKPAAREPGAGTDEKHGPGGSSSASLHAKTFAVDGSRIFVGSFNFDPRSARLKHRDGAPDRQPHARRAAHAVLRQGYSTGRLRSAACGRRATAWNGSSARPAGEQRYDTEPGVGLMQTHVRGLSCRCCRSTGCCDQPDRTAERHCFHFITKRGRHVALLSKRPHLPRVETLRFGAATTLVTRSYEQEAAVGLLVPATTI